MGSLIITRAWLLLLAASCSSALTPLSAAADDNDCALYLSGPGRTSAYDYSLNLLKGNFGYEGQHTCITYDAVNQAYLEARNRIVVAQPKGEWKAEDYASVGELILDISINLARRYGLTYEEIEKGLPLIDTSRTLIREVCPPVFSHVECRAGKYRRLDGLCNNLQHPTWGATMAPFQRLIGPLFADGINAPRIAHTGRDLPLSRVVSRTMHPDEGFHDHAGTVMVIAWGQFMDHDYTLTGTPLDPLNRNDPEECCKRPPHLKHPYCNEIRIPDDDYFYRLWGVKCIDFVRAFPSPRPGCRLGSRVPFNTLTGVLDGNTVYGVTDKFARKLRTGYGGLLRMNPVFKEYGLKDLLPLKLDIPDEGCTRPNKNMFCFEAGEIRASEQLVLTVMHTLMAREHNRVAEGLAQVNPHWDDETLYQEARRINIAEIQHITYNEFLPILLGKDVMEKFGLVLEKEGYWDGYDPAVNPDVIDSFAAAAYRFGHSLLPTAVERWSKAHKFIASKRLSDLIRRPFDLYRAGVLDEYVMGLMNQVAQAMDDSITQEVTNHLFKKVGARFGMDLVSFNMQRGREFGVPGYMEFRKFCGLAGADSFEDLFGSMPNETVRKYETIFEHPIDVDLWSGGVSERPLPGSMLGPTFACIIATQFSYSRRGDRFWYELPNQPSSFTPEQLVEVRKARLARVICDNTDIIDTVQLYPMVLPDHELNPRVPCRSGIIPSIDFSKWAEPAPFHSGPKPFITEAFININNKTENETEEQKTRERFDTTTIANNNETVTEATTKTVNETAQLTKCNGTQNCAAKLNNSCSDCTIKLKEGHGSDTILKYVYKKGDKIENTSKSNGDPKNILKRKRRYVANALENKQFPSSAPLIVNYETSHFPEVSQPSAKNTANVIQGASLADFNIETSHGAQLDKNIEKIKNRAKQFDLPSSIENYDRNRGETTNQKENENSKENSKYSDDRKHNNRDDTNNNDINKFIEAEKDQEDSKSTEDYRDDKHSKEIDDSEESTVHNSEESYEKADKNSPYKQTDYTERTSNEQEKHDSYDHDERDDKNRDNTEESYEKGEKSSPYKRGKETTDYTKRASDESKEKFDSFERTTPYKKHDERKERERDNYYKRGETDESGEVTENENSEEKDDYKEKSPNQSQEINDSYYKNPEEKNEKNNHRERDSNESKERYETSAKLYPESKEKDEYNNKENRQNSPENYDSRENEYSNSDQLSPSSESSKENKESAEQNDDVSFYPRQDSNEKYNEDDGRSINKKFGSEISEKENYHKVDNLKSNEETNVNDTSEEEEAIIAIMKKKKKKPLTEVPDAYDNKSAPFIKDVDLADFTYETIHVNEKGQVEPVKDEPENYHKPPLIAPLTTSRPDTLQRKNEQLTRARPREEISSNYDSNEDNKPHRQIDDLEIKPVVEINPEKGVSDEQNSKEAIKTLSNEDASLETFLGIKDINSGEKSDKIIAKEKLEEENGNVKQQFERIPLNYNLAKKQEQEENNANAPTKSSNSEAADDLHNGIKGTLDVITPRYDEQLNIKFDDVSIKLPEIKLPEDILNIPHDYYKPPYNQREEKPQEPIKEKFFRYDENEYNAHEPHGPEHKHDHEGIQDHDDTDDDVHHYGYHGKNKKKNNDYKKKETQESDDDEEDLYEKFVRERFGKKGSFEHRSEKLRSTPSIDNEKLFKSLQLVLNKAQNIEKEAKKSGDPNAGYLWTVEYGQQL